MAVARRTVTVKLDEDLVGRARRRAGGSAKPDAEIVEEARRHPDFPRHWNGTDRGPLMLECTRPGVFAVGDVRRGSTKRVVAVRPKPAFAALFRERAMGKERERRDSNPRPPA